MAEEGDMVDETRAQAAPKDGKASTVNSQITDSVDALLQALQKGSGGHAAAMGELARVQATAMKDFQAVARQQADATIMSATATAAVAKMIGAKYEVAEVGSGVVALAEAQGIAAITMLKSLRDAAGANDLEAAAALARLRASAADEAPSAKKEGTRR